MVESMKSRKLIERVSQDAEKKGNPSRLTRADWLQNGLNMLIETGVDSVKITRLADNLGVTRGSFYWHFQDRDELLDAMLGVWKQLNTDSIVAAVQQNDTLQDRVLALFELWLNPDSFDPRLDFAVRDWARGDAKLQGIISQADHRRLEVLIEMFVQHGCSESTAIIRARNLYFTQMGYYALNVRETVQDRVSYVSIYYETYTDEKLSPEAEAAFRKRIFSNSSISSPCR